MDDAESSLIYDVSQITRFAFEVLKCDGSQIYLTSIAARKKYSPGVKCRKGFFRREEIMNTTPQKFLQRIKQYQIVGDYLDDAGQPLPLESLVIYTTVNPRDRVKALKILSKKCWEAAWEAPDHISLVSWAKSALQMKGSAIKEYVTIDIDDPSITAEVNAMFDECELTANFTVVTRGGYHVLIRLSTLTSLQKQFIFKNLPISFPEPLLSVDSDMMCPVPGTIQGGHRVTFYTGNPRME